MLTGFHRRGQANRLTLTNETWHLLLFVVYISISLVGCFPRHLFVYVYSMNKRLPSVGAPGFCPVWLCIPCLFFFLSFLFGSLWRIFLWVWASFVLLGTYTVQRKESVASWRTVVWSDFLAHFPWLIGGCWSVLVKILVWILSCQLDCHRSLRLLTLSRVEGLLLMMCWIILYRCFQCHLLLDSCSS